jgi:hypothetical protein
MTAGVLSKNSKAPFFIAGNVTAGIDASYIIKMERRLRIKSQPPSYYLLSDVI